MGNEVDIVIKKYSDFLTDSWNSIKYILKIDEYIDNEINYLYDDWLQVNWELLVGSALCKKDDFIVEYGSPDYVFFNPIKINKNAQLYEPYCKPKENKVVDLFTNRLINDIEKLSFMKYVGFEDNCYLDRAPFNFILLEDEKSNLFIINKDDIIFKLRKVVR